MLDIETIKLNEENNDGRSVFLYYDRMIGLYVGYGLSAYYTTLVTDPFISYSEELQMPVALFERAHILYLRQSLQKVEHKEKQFYLFKLRNVVGREGYSRWEEQKKPRMRYDK